MTTRSPNPRRGGRVEPAFAPRARTAAAIYAALALLWFLPAFLPDRQIFGTDYLAAGYPVSEMAAAQLAAGELPGWIPQLYGGVPHAANPGSTYHPVRLLASLVLPFERQMPALLVVHFALAGLGTFLLVHALGARPWVAFVTGLAFQFTGVTMSAVYAGHDGRIVVATLAPLFLWCLHAGVRTGRVAPFAGAAAVLGTALLSFQLQSVHYLLLAGFAWGVFLLVHGGFLRRPRALLQRAGLGVAAVALGFAVAAVALLPFAHYLAESPRGGAGGPGYAFSASFSMPPAELLGVAVPEQAGVLDDYRGTNPFKLHTEYVGALVLVLVATGVATLRRDRRAWFLAGLAAVALSIAFGGHTPLYRLYHAVIPGIAQTRAPAIAFYLVALALVVLAGLALERLAALRDERATAGRAARVAGRASVAIVGASVVGALAALDTAGGEPASFGWLRFALCAALVGAALHAWLTGRIGARAAALALALVGIADLTAVVRPFLRTDAPPAELYAADDVVAFLQSQPAHDGVRDRVFVLPGAEGAAQPMLGDGRFGPRSNYLMYAGLDNAGGEHGNQLRRWNEYVGLGTDGGVDWHNFVAWTPFMEATNVGWIVTRATLALTRAADGTPLGGIRLAHDGPVKVYRNERALPRAYLVPAVRDAADTSDAFRIMQSPAWDPRRVAVVADPVASEALLALAGAPATVPPASSDERAHVAAYAPNEIVVRATAARPMLLVLADNFAPGWTATVDGRDAPVVRANHTLRAVALDAGAHEVVFRYEAPGLRRGLAISVAATLLLALVAVGAGAAELRARRPTLAAA